MPPTVGHNGNVTTNTYLARQAARGDKDALNRLVERHRVLLFRVALREVHGYADADDAVANALVRVCQNIHAHHDAPRFVAWICAIVRNEARRIGERNGIYAARFAPLDLDTVGSGRNEAHLADLRLDVRRALTTLPETHALVLSLFYLGGATTKEIAQTVQRPEGTVKWILAQGRKRLSQELKGYETMSETVYRAVLVAPNVDAVKRDAWATALRGAGWSDVAVVPDADNALNIGGKDEIIKSAPFYKTGQQLVVLHERIGEASAYELLPLLLAARRQGDFAILLLLDSGRGKKSSDLAALSAYISGVDILLTEPVDLEEFATFAGKLYDNATRQKLVT